MVGLKEKFTRGNGWSSFRLFFVQQTIRPLEALPALLKEVTLSDLGSLGHSKGILAWTIFREAFEVTGNFFKNKNN
jgi:hypothetical protein